MAGTPPIEIARHFPSTDLALIGDELADGIELGGPGDTIPLSLFDALRTDYSLARLAHYTGTPPEHFQRFVLFTNYHRYVDEFVDWAAGQLGKDGYVALSGAGGLYLTEPVDNARGQLSDTAWRRHQMPAYHLMARRRFGHHAGQHRRRPVQREDDLRPPGGAAARGLADDRPLRRPAAEPVDRRLCAGPRLSARRPRARRSAAARNPDPGDRRSPAGPRERSRGSERHARRRPEAAHAHRHRRHHRRSQLGTALYQFRPRASRSAARSRSTWKARRSPPRAIASACPTGRCCASRTSRCTARSSCRARPTSSTKKRSRAHLQIGIHACKRLRAEGPRLHSRKLRAFNEPPFR